MKKKIMLLISVFALAVVVFGIIGTGAWWAVPTYANDNVVQAATFGMTIGDTGTDTATGLCNFTNWAPGDDPQECKIALKNEGSIPINVVWSGFSLTGDSVMQDWVFLTGFSDSNGTTTLTDIMGFDANGDGKLSIKEAAPALANGYFSDPNGTLNSSSMFLDVGESGYVSLTFAFGADAPNATIGKSIGFNWTLTAQQLPKNTNP